MPHSPQNLVPLLIGAPHSVQNVVDDESATGSAATTPATIGGAAGGGGAEEGCWYWGTPRASSMAAGMGWVFICVMGWGFIGTWCDVMTGEVAGMRFCRIDVDVS